MAADDTDITDATGSTYTLAAADEEKTVKVRVSFTDDRGHQETLTSTATAAVTAAPSPLTVSVESAPTSHKRQRGVPHQGRLQRDARIGLQLHHYARPRLHGDRRGCNRRAKAGQRPRTSAGR